MTAPARFGAHVAGLAEPFQVLPGVGLFRSGELTERPRAWLAELWPTCREVSREERETRREVSEVRREMLRTTFPQPVENGPETVDRGAA